MTISYKFAIIACTCALKKKNEIELFDKDSCKQWCILQQSG